MGSEHRRRGLELVEKLRGRLGHPAMARPLRADKDARGSGKAGANSILRPELSSLKASVTGPESPRRAWAEAEAVFWLVQTRGTTLVYPQAQLSSPNPPIHGPEPGMSGQLGISHSKTPSEAEFSCPRRCCCCQEVLSEV